MKEYTEQRVREVLEQIAQEFPDKLAEHFSIGVGPAYHGCRYMHPDTGEPSCVVGVALHRLGIPEPDIAALDWEATTNYSYLNGGPSRCPQSVQGSKAPFWGRFEPAARGLLAYVQRRQDSGMPWGQAIAQTLGAGS